MDKEDMVRIYNVILLNHKKEWYRVVCRDVDGPRDYHTEWSKSEREKQISYIKCIYVESRKMAEMILFAKQK